MSTPSAERLTVVRFLESFLQEKNIRWMLLSGLAILIGSSLILVTSHWSDWSPILKYLAVVGYTLAAYVSGRVVLDVLKLPKTGSTLLALVVLLIPVTFLIPHQIFSAADATMAGNVVALSLLTLHAAVACYAAVDISRRLLGGWQPTFVASYLVLSLAGIAVPFIPSSWEYATILGLWSVMTIGSIKINRHIFWLTEELRAPRIFGFLPILLLGSQFAGLAALINPPVNIAWFGPIILLVAIPIYATADSLLRVFQQRTGGLVHPLPIAIIVPILLATMLASSGVILSAAGIVEPSLRLPFLSTTFLATGLFLSVGLRFRQTPFVYASLSCLILAYAFIPALSPQLADHAKESFSHILGIKPLPLSLRGFCYLPLIGIFLLAERRWKDSLPFITKPVWHITSILSVALLAFALTDMRALFVVGLPFTAIFLYMALRSRTSLFLIPAAIAWMMASVGVGTFLFNEFHYSLPFENSFAICSLANAIVLIASRLLSNRFSQTISIRRWSFAATLLMTSLLGLAAMITWLPVMPFDEFLIPCVSVAGLLFLHTIYLLRPELAGGFVLWTQASVLALIMKIVAGPKGLYSPFELSDYQVLVLVVSATILALLGWMIHRVISRPNGSNLTVAFSKALSLISTTELLTLLGFLQAILVDNLLHSHFPGHHHSEILRLDINRPVYLELLAVLSVWGLYATHHLRTRVVGMLASTGLLVLTIGVASLTLTDPLWTIVPVAAVGLVMMLISGSQRRSAEQYSPLLWSLSFVGIATLVVVSLLGLCIYQTPCLVGAGIAVFAWLIESIRTRILALRQAAFLLIHLHIASLPVVVMGGASLAVILNDPMSIAAAYPWLVLILWGGAGMWMIRHATKRSSTDDMSLSCWFILSGMGFVSIAGCFFMPTWTLLDTLLVVTAALMGAICQLESARVSKLTEEVIFAWGIALSTLPLLIWHQVISIGTPWGPIVLASTGIGLYLLAWIFQTTNRYSIAEGVTRHFSQIVLLMAVAVAILREFALPFHGGMNAIALLIVAAFYFARWIENNNRWSLIFAAALSNVALAFTARQLHWSDPQVFMIPLGATILLLVEVLRQDVPHQLRAPLRYAGSLVILVSPLWNILDGSWVPYFTLMAASMAIILLAMGLRVRSLLYIGTAFLCGDLTAILVRGCLDKPDLLWVAGLGLGTVVIVLAAACERKREQIVARIQSLSAALQQWD